MRIFSQCHRDVERFSYYVRLIALCEGRSNTESCSLAINSLKEELKKRESGSGLRTAFKT